MGEKLNCVAAAPLTIRCLFSWWHCGIFADEKTDFLRFFEFFEKRTNIFLLKIKNGNAELPGVLR